MLGRAGWLLWLLLAGGAAGCSGESVTAVAGTGPGGGGAGGSGGAGIELPVFAPEFDCPPGSWGEDCEPAGISPARCGDVLIPDGDGSCTSDVPSCATGMMAAVGETECRPVAECGASPWAGIPDRADTQWVDQSSTSASPDGSQSDPWPTIADAIAAAAPGAVVGIAPGTYTEALDIDGKLVHLWGKCPSEVTIAGGDSEALRVIGVDGMEIRRIGFTSDGTRTVRLLATSALLEQVWIHDSGGSGIDAVGSIDPLRTITLRDSLIEKSGGYGSNLGVVNLIAERSVLRELGLSSAASGEAILNFALINSPGTSVSLDRVLIEDVVNAGVDAGGVSVVARDSVIRRVDRVGSADVSGGIHVSNIMGARGRPSVDLQRVVIEDCVPQGIKIVEADLTAEALAIRDVGIFSPGYGDGIAVEDFAIDDLGPMQVELTAVTVDRVRDGGLFSYGAHVTARGLRIREVAEGISGAGIGVLISDEDLVSPPLSGAAELEGVVVTDVAGAGIALRGSDAVLSSVSVDGVSAGAFGGRCINMERQQGIGTLTLSGSALQNCVTAGLVTFGVTSTLRDVLIESVAPDGDDHGACVQLQPDEGVASTLTTQRVELAGCAGFGLVQLGGEAVVTKSTIRDVLAHPTQGWGDGLAAIQQGDTSLTIDEVVITNVARAGIASFGAPVTVTATYSWCNGFHLNGEPFAGRDATFDDLGGNHCGCGDSEEPCKVVSEDLSPPSL